MDDRPVRWDRWNRKHLVEDHRERNLTVAEIEEAMSDPRRFEVYVPERDSNRVLGRTSNGRLLYVVWVERYAGRYPIQANQAGRRLQRRVRK